jgi:hypothetical protein
VHVFRATALPFHVPSDERRCQVLNLWPGVPLNPGLSDLTRVATVIPARRGTKPRRRRARAAGALSGASATLVFGHRPSTSRPPSASCRPFCYRLPGLMRSRERTASRRSAVSVLRTTARWAEVLHESLSRRSGRAVRASSGVETQSGRVRSEGDLEAGARRAEPSCDDNPVVAKCYLHSQTELLTHSVLPPGNSWPIVQNACRSPQLTEQPKQVPWGDESGT